MRDNTFSKKVFIKTVSDNLKNKYRKTIDDATQQELYQAVSEAVKDVIMDEWIATQRVMDKDDPKVVYYMSMEFLMGRALGNNLINLSAYKEVKEALAANEIRVEKLALESQVGDLTLELNEKNAQLEEKDSVIQEKNNQIEERTSQLLEKQEEIDNYTAQIKTYDVVLHVKPEKASQIHAQVINGEKCLVIPMRENENATINGVNTNL